MLIHNLNDAERRVYLYLQKNGPCTKKDLLNALELKPSSLNRILERLNSENHITEHTGPSPRTGRRPFLYDIKASKKYLIGIDISRTAFSIVLCDLKMNILLSDRIRAVHTYRSSYSAVNKICETVLQLLEKNDIHSSCVLGVGVSMVGPVDMNSGITGNITGFPSNDWSRFPVKQLISDMLGLPVFVDSGAYAAVLYEYLYGAGKKYRSIAFINSSFGIRAGYINSNVLVRAADNDESALAHTIIIPHGERCSCGKRGCANCYATTSSVFRNIQGWIRNGGSFPLDIPTDKVFFPEIVQAAEAGNQICRREIILAGEMFGYALSNYITLFNPELVIVSGVAINLSEMYYESLMNTVTTTLQKDNHVVFQKGGSQKALSMAVGAAAMFFERLLGNPILG